MRPATICSNLINDILDLSKIESGTVDRRCRGGALRRPAPTRGTHVPPCRGGEGAWTSASSSTPTCRAVMLTDAKRLQQVLKNLLSNAFKFTREGGVRSASRRPRAAGAATTTVLNRAPSGHRLLGDATPASASRRKAADHLRGVPAGRRQHQPQVRRHRPRPRHQPRACPPARRRDPAAEHARQGQHVHAVPADRLCRSRPAARARAPTAPTSAAPAAAVALERADRASCRTTGAHPAGRPPCC